ncbi:LysR family transcriptional regulator [Aestuariibacter sp. A3R04]|nr:LysR family transcriptional regulator [Aestuariibacter sp. A3R04]
MVKADDILLFISVVEAGSFSKVSEKQNITLSVVSKRISRLEKALNVPLLYRTTRKLSLTHGGQALYKKAKIAQRAFQDAQDVVSGFGLDVKGRINITMPVVTANLVLNSALAEFCEQYPDISVSLHVSNRVVDLVDEGFDLAIRTTHLEDSSLVARRLIDSSWVVCASPHYLKTKGIPEHPDALSTHECLIYQSPGTDTRDWYFKDEEKHMHVTVNGRFYANTLDSLKQLALDGMGIAYLPKALVYDALHEETLSPVLSTYTAKRLGIFAVYPKSRQPDRKLALLVEHFRTALQRQAHCYS